MTTLSEEEVERICERVRAECKEELDKLRCELNKQPIALPCPKCGQTPPVQHGRDGGWYDAECACEVRKELEEEQAENDRLRKELGYALASEKQLNGYLVKQTMRANKFEAENIRLLETLKNLSETHE